MLNANDYSIKYNLLSALHKPGHILDSNHRCPYSLATTDPKLMRPPTSISMLEMMDNVRARATSVQLVTVKHVQILVLSVSLVASLKFRHTVPYLNSGQVDIPLQPFSGGF